MCPSGVTDVSEALAAHLARIDESARVRSVTPLKGGSCQDNYKVELTIGGEERTMVLRSDAKRSLAGSITRQAESTVINAAAERGVKTPRARHLADGLLRPGAFAYLLDWVDGEAIGSRVVRDPKLANARAGLAVELAGELAKIHSIGPDAKEVEIARPVEPVLDALQFAIHSVDSLDERRPGLELALRWLAEHTPDDRTVTLVHGDFRTGNFLVGENGLNAILDWEFAHFGCPAEDLAWLCLRNWRFGENKKGCGGFATRRELYDAYAKATGKPVNAADVHFWEVLGNVRWSAGCIQQGERYLSGEESDLELIAIPRRAAEMEYEALRLIEEG